MSPDEIELTLNRARRYCAYQERCGKEVEMRLKAWKVKPSAAEQVIKQLKEENYIDDERFARNFASGRFRIKHWGRTKIAYELKGKGIPEDLITKALEEIDGEEYKNVLHEVLMKKDREMNEEDPFVRKKKLVAFAMGKGFEYSMAKEVAEEVLRF